MNALSEQSFEQYFFLPGTGMILHQAHLLSGVLKMLDNGSDRDFLKGNMHASAKGPGQVKLKLSRRGNKSSTLAR